ncbi:MAG: AmmeMemoRadiSam system protein A [Candidatus Gastranaerophilales bacterium]|nr:AmmeMemoRadiSam system protein A [Candidatus Gastranaerophilales bacterium]
MKPQELARLTVETYIKTGKMPDKPDKLEGVDVKTAGTFVSIKTMSGELRGCIGTIQAVRDSIIDEIMNNAVSSAHYDPRFSPIKQDELPNLKYSVDILHEPEKVTDFRQLDPKNYGIIISSETGKKALLLPDLEGLDTVEKQLTACMRKAGIQVNEAVTIQRFRAERFSE